MDNFSKKSSSIFFIVCLNTFLTESSNWEQVTATANSAAFIIPYMNKKVIQNLQVVD